MKYVLLLAILSTAKVSAQHTADILIRNGKIIDGTGNSWFYGDVAVSKGKIAATGNLSKWKSAKIIDAAGLIITPGFIDVHTHIEGDEAGNPLAANFIKDGVTTVVTGNCGFSKIDMSQYFAYITKLGLSINVASLVGHNDIREAAMGKANRAPTALELGKMQDLVKKAMQDGAVGFSTGLIYNPGNFAQTGEIVTLAKIAAKYQGVYATHMRNEGDSITYALDEAFLIAKEAGIPLQVSHLKLSGQQNWGRSNEALSMIKKAREEGVDVTIDQYPYTASSTSVQVLLPDWILADGKDSLVQRLQRKEVRDETVEYIVARLKKRKLDHFDYAVVAWYGADTTLNGKSIEAINLLWNREHSAAQEALTIIDMVIKGGAAMVFHGMSEDDVKSIMQYPFNMVASDGGIRVFNEGSPHPRSYGTNARVLGKYVREEKILSLEEAIRRMTSLPAQKFHLTDRGLLREGFAADIVVFDPVTVTDKSAYESPHQYSTGFKYVLVNGKLTVENEKHTGITNGTILYGPGKKK